ncbi:MAG: hypothetical protein ABIP85_20070 [Chthoniobacteraceae bacterium]
MNAPVTIAMRFYASWTERIFSEDGFENLLMLGMIVTPIVALFLARRHTGETRFISGAFALALSPVMFAAVIALLRIHSLIEHEDLSSPTYIVERLRFVEGIIVFGTVLCTFTVAIYSAIHAGRRRTKQLSSDHHISNDNRA